MCLWDRSSSSGAVARASIFDEYIRGFLVEHPSGTVADLGCGLSTRFDRLDNGTTRWFDLDLPDVMQLRGKFFSESGRYTMLSGSVLDTDWFEKIPTDQPVLLVSEAVFLYFSDDVARAALTRIAERFRGNRLALDSSGKFMINHQDSNPLIRNMPARMRWICEDPKSLEMSGLHIIESRTFAQPQPNVAKKWPLLQRFFMKVLAPTPMVSGYRMNLFRL